jgi:hypothetical protein
MMTARDLKRIGALFNRDWPSMGPVRCDTRIKRQGEVNKLDGTFTAGDTKIGVKLDAHLKKTPIKISGTMTAEKFFPWDFFQKVSDARERESSGALFVFGREPIAHDWMQKLDMDLHINIESFAQETILADSAQGHVVLKSGLLTIGPARIVYPRGKLDMALRFDTRGDPHLSIRAHGEHIDPWATLNIQESRKAIAGEMNVDVSVDTSGKTPHEMASNCRGNIYLTAQNGKLRASFADLLFLDIAGWAWRKTTGEQFYNIDCGVAEFAMEKGVVSTEAFVIDTSDILITGDGTIDLGREDIQYVLLPKKKAQFIGRADPVHIQGPLNNPSVETIPLKSAMSKFATYGGMVFAPYVFVPLVAAERLTGWQKDKRGESPCLKYQRERSKVKKGEGK